MLVFDVLHVGIVAHYSTRCNDLHLFERVSIACLMLVFPSRQAAMYRAWQSHLHTGSAGLQPAIIHQISAIEPESNRPAPELFIFRWRSIPAIGEWTRQTSGCSASRP